MLFEHFYKRMIVCKSEILEGTNLNIYLFLNRSAYQL